MSNIAYVKTPSGEELAVLPRAELEAIVEAGKHAIEIADYRAGRSPGLSTEQALEFATAPSPLAFWRKYRGLTQRELAHKAGIAQNYVSDLENGKRSGDVGKWLRLARILELPLEAIVDDE